MKMKTIYLDTSFWTSMFKEEFKALVKEQGFKVIEINLDLEKPTETGLYYTTMQAMNFRDLLQMDDVSIVTPIAYRHYTVNRTIDYSLSVLNVYTKECGLDGMYVAMGLGKPVTTPLYFTYFEHNEERDRVDCIVIDEGEIPTFIHKRINTLEGFLRCSNRIEQTIFMELLEMKPTVENIDKLMKKHGVIDNTVKWLILTSDLCKGGEWLNGIEEPSVYLELKIKGHSGGYGNGEFRFGVWGYSHYYVVESIREEMVKVLPTNWIERAGVVLTELARTLYTNGTQIETVSNTSADISLIKK